MPTAWSSIPYSERLYRALLRLYPVRFRIRFASEMTQLFRDCRRDAFEKGGSAAVAAFWVRALRDLLVSILRERSRELMTPLDAEHPLIRIIDLLLIPSMVTANLLALGPIFTLLILSGATIPFNQFAATSALFSFAAGAAAVAASIIITRLRPTARLWVKLSA